MRRMAATWPEPARRSPRGLLVLAVVLAHGLLGLALSDQMRRAAGRVPHAGAEEPQRAPVLWLTDVQPQAPAQQEPQPLDGARLPAAQQPRRAPRTPQARSATADRLQTPNAAAHERNAAPVLPPEVGAISAQPLPGAALPSQQVQTAGQLPGAEAPASAQLRARTPLLDSEASRRAIRELARRETWADRHYRVTESAPPATADERLAREIQQAGRGDCLKGEYLGGGGGLLSLPFWLLAEARGKCAR